MIDQGIRLELDFLTVQATMLVVEVVAFRWSMTTNFLQDQSQDVVVEAKRLLKDKSIQRPHLEIN